MSSNYDFSAYLDDNGMYDVTAMDDPTKGLLDSVFNDIFFNGDDVAITLEDATEVEA